MARVKHLIIGCGPAAVSAAATIRSLKPDDEIKVVSKEDGGPYSRAGLPYVLAGRATEADLFQKEAGSFARLSVEFIGGKEAVRIVANERRVLYRDGGSDTYDALLIACGAAPANSSFEGGSQDNLPSFHSLSDLRRLMPHVKPGRHITILGAGMVAVELAAALAERGCGVRIIGRGRPLRAYFSQEAGDCIEAILAGKGVEILTGRTIARVAGNSGGFTVTCAGGESFETGLVVSCVGVGPRLDLARNSGISTDRGILVDRKMRTSVDGIYAAGDVAEAPSFHAGIPGVCAILPEAIAQGKVAGAGMAGNDAEYPGWVQVNLLKLFGESAFSAGLAAEEVAGAETLEMRDAVRRQFRRLVFSRDRLIGATFVNVAADPGVILYLIRHGVSIGARSQALLEQPFEMARWLMLRAERGQAASRSE